MELVVDHQGLGAEFDWLAADGDGHVGYFATAGAGPVPVDVAAAFSSYDGLQEAVMLLSRRCTAVAAASSVGDIGDWVEIARRGFFAFDWNRSRSSYQLIARPSSPATAHDLPESLVGLARRVKLNFFLTHVPVEGCVDLNDHEKEERSHR